MLPQLNYKGSAPLSCESNKNIKNVAAMQHMIWGGESGISETNDVAAIVWEQWN